MFSHYKQHLALVVLSSLTFSFGNHQADTLFVEAETNTYTTSFNDFPWKDVNGSYSTRADYTKAPFIVEEETHSFLFSAGYDDATGGPRLGSQNSTAYQYHDFDQASLWPFRNLTSNPSEAVIAMTTSLVGHKVTNVSFSWNATYNGPQDVHLIYSLDDGSNWHIATSGATTSGSPLVFSNVISGNHLRIGILTGYKQLAYRYLENPTISFLFEPMTDNESASSLMELVATYTPCETDTLGLLLSSDAIATSLADQYNSLSENARAILNGGLMEDDTPYRQRLDLILEAHGQTISVNPDSINEITNYSSIVFMAILSTGIIVYGTTKRKYR
jgi:hypothetical protein